jgi:hypothetical protein
MRSSSNNSSSSSLKAPPLYAVPSSSGNVLDLIHPALVQYFILHERSNSLPYRPAEAARTQKSPAKLTPLSDPPSSKPPSLVVTPLTSSTTSNLVSDDDWGEDEDVFAPTKRAAATTPPVRNLDEGFNTFPRVVRRRTKRQHPKLPKLQIYTHSTPASPKNRSPLSTTSPANNNSPITRKRRQRAKLARHLGEPVPYTELCQVDGATDMEEVLELLARDAREGKENEAGQMPITRPPAASLEQPESVWTCERGGKCVVLDDYKAIREALRRL